MKLIDEATAADKIAEKTDLQLNELVDIFAEIPGVDAVPVVRCRDCVYYHDNFRCGWWKDVTKDDGFCAHGRRKSK